MTQTEHTGKTWEWLVCRARDRHSCMCLQLMYQVQAQAGEGVECVHRLQPEEHRSLGALIMVGIPRQSRATVLLNSGSGRVNNVLTLVE